MRQKQYTRKQHKPDLRLQNLQVGGASLLVDSLDHMRGQVAQQVISRTRALI